MEKMDCYKIRSTIENRITELFQTAEKIREEMKSVFDHSEEKKMWVQLYEMKMERLVLTQTLGNLDKHLASFMGME